MLQYIKKDNPILLPILLLATLALWSGVIIKPTFIESVFEKHPMPLYRFILLLPDKASWWISIILSLLVFMQGFFLNQLSSRFRLIDSGTYLPGILYVLFVSSFHILQQINPVVFANIFLIWTIHVIFPTYRVEKTIDPFFIGAFLISTGSLFYFPLIFFTIILFFFMINTRSFYWREWFVALLGLFAPYLFAFSAYFIYGKTALLLETMDNQITFNSNTQFIDFRYIFYYVFMSLTLVSGSVFLYRSVFKKVVTRKYYSLLLFIWVLTSILFGLIPSLYLETAYLFAIPFAFFVSNIMINTKSRLAENMLIFGTIVILILINNV